MDTTQQLAVLSRNSHTGGRAVGSHHTARPDSPASTQSGSSPGNSQRKASMDIERHARPFPDKLTRSGSRELALTSPSRRMASIPSPLPSHLAMAQPTSSGSPGSSHSHSCIASFQTSAPSTEPVFSSSSCAAAIARLAEADSTLTRPPAVLSLSPLPPTPNTHVIPQQLPSSVEALDRSSLNVLSDEIDAPPPPIVRALSHPASLTPGYRPLRATTLPTPLPTRFSIEGVSARLSPAIITRQPQHPILSLPPISPTSTPVNEFRPLRSRSLRSVPALPMEGSDDPEPAEHGNADLDDLDEEDEGVVDGDEDTEEENTEADLPDTASEDGDSISCPLTSETSRPDNLPAIDVTPLDLSFLDASKNGTVRQDDKTPKGHQMMDYFNSKHAESSQLTNFHPLPTARASAWNTPVLPTSTSGLGGLTAAGVGSAPRILPTPSTPIHNSRSGLYHQASRSMSDMAEILKQHRTPEMAATTPKSPLCDPVPEADPPVLESEEPDTQLGPSIRRRRLSMPTFGPSTAPPPYPEFRFGERRAPIRIQPRDEEGCEHLPPYTNDIYLRAIMPRKMEFSAPGVQARDRKWRRTLCILEGTAFRVYRCPPTVTGKGLIGNLWEKTVGVGDIASPSTPASSPSAKTKERERDREARRAKLDGVDSTLTQSPPSSPALTSISGPSQLSNDPEAQSSPSSTRSRLLPTNFRRKNRAASGASDAASTFSPLHQATMESSSSRGASPPPYVSAPTPRVPSVSATPVLGPPRTPGTPHIKHRHLWVDDPAVPLPQEQDLLHAYMLHSAESGLGSDYLKRRNVIRIRMEGEQFLLQARDVASVVDWIEVRPAGIVEQC